MRHTASASAVACLAAASARGWRGGKVCRGALGCAALLSAAALHAARRALHPLEAALLGALIACHGAVLAARAAALPRGAARAAAGRLSACLLGAVILLGAVVFLGTVVLLGVHPLLVGRHFLDRSGGGALLLAEAIGQHPQALMQHERVVPIVISHAVLAHALHVQNAPLVEVLVVLPRRDHLSALHQGGGSRLLVQHELARCHPLRRIVIEGDEHPLGRGQQLGDHAVREFDSRQARPHLRAKLEAVLERLGRPLLRLLGPVSGGGCRL
mmetsp:Transcript_26574/g.53397  ORF Transcript_26574/g.53397 Transcript_26574/m.53397 type:complete len:271 (-) Transcript_26574:1601-2413(-)